MLWEDPRVTSSHPSTLLALVFLGGAWSKTTTDSIAKVVIGSVDLRDLGRGTSRPASPHASRFSTGSRVTM
ncbi:hypothetical protein CC80DRAFT_290000 [Byssothecium circinans]|uniref:Uncharacterized protein n=1 Tax=Byssothecium circinans TaxID=147558 RepID=A0A6A5U5W0_9PLEO|nr:hypothetical protein CC80DRAFT_290000 [Byssothecium circinans]